MVMNRIPEQRHRAAQGLTELQSGQLSDKQSREINGWKSDNPEYREEFLATARLLADMEALADDPEVLALAIEPSRPKIQLYATAAAMILAVVVGLMWPWPKNTADIDAKRYITRVGEQRQVVMDDGTTIHMNTATQMIVAVSDTERKVTLTRGEAYFDVVSDPERPFTVDAGYRSVTVLGTEFNILRSPENIQVAVTEGVVALHSTEEGVRSAVPVFRGQTDNETTHQIRVEAGWQVNFDARMQSLTGSKLSNTNDIANWRSGLLEFAGEPLFRVVKELNRYSAKKILVEDSSIIDLKIFAAVKVDRMDLALDGLEHTLPIRVTHHFDRIVLTRKQ